MHANKPEGIALNQQRGCAHGLTVSTLDELQGRYQIHTAKLLGPKINAADRAEILKTTADYKMMRKKERVAKCM